jgi:hypothetical protein
MLRVNKFRAIDATDFESSANKSKLDKATVTVTQNPNAAFNSESYAYIFEAQCLDNKNQPGMVKTEKSYNN